MRLLLLLTCAFAACVHVPSLESLPESQRDDLEVCLFKIDDAVCRGDRLCMQEVVEGYVTAKDKMRFLVRHGCPKDMVEAGIEREVSR